VRKVVHQRSGSDDLPAAIRSKSNVRGAEAGKERKRDAEQAQQNAPVRNNRVKRGRVGSVRDQTVAE